MQMEVMDGGVVCVDGGVLVYGSWMGGDGAAGWSYDSFNIMLNILTHNNNNKM